MKRKLFFWLEKLKITRAERYAVCSLMGVLVGLLCINSFVKPSSAFNRPYYKALEKQFQQRTALLKQKDQKLLARYKKPGAFVSSAADTLPDEKRSSPKSAVANAININTADAKTLQNLHGIGGAYAQHIIDYRRNNGAFKSKDELLNVKGIGKARFQKIEPFITLGDSTIPIRTSHMDTLSSYQTQAKTAQAGDKKSTEAQTIININTADVATLQKLPGIGPAYAQRIVAYRQKNGAFATKDELLKIKGIGKKRLAKIKPFIKLTGH